MKRIRSIHPGFFSSRIAKVGLLARFLFIGLWTLTDDAGVFLWDPWQIKVDLLPGDGSVAEIDNVLNELAGLGVVRRFEADGQTYGAICNFVRYQRPKSPRQLYPCPPSLRTYLGFAPDGTRPREMAKTLEARRSDTSSELVRNSLSNIRADNKGEKDTPSRKEQVYQDRAIAEDYTWDHM